MYVALLRSLWCCWLCRFKVTTTATVLLRKVIKVTACRVECVLQFAFFFLHSKKKTNKQTQALSLRSTRMFKQSVFATTYTRLHANCRHAAVMCQCYATTTYFTENHTYVETQDGNGKTVKIGLTHYGQDNFGTINYVEFKTQVSIACDCLQILMHL